MTNYLSKEQRTVIQLIPTLKFATTVIAETVGITQRYAQILPQRY